jgi:glycosyltransferase involved in cell wall biosynthesis
MSASILVEEDSTSPQSEPLGEISGCVSVIIPVYNEVHSVTKLLALVQDAPVEKEIIVVDDGSTDGTREELMKSALAPNITVILRKGNHGKGAAIRTGLRYARGEYLLIQDSDLEYDPQDYPALLEPLRYAKANVVYGVRPDHPERGLSYYLGAKFLTLLANVLYNCNIRDEATCYKAFRHSVFKRIDLTSRRFEFCPEVTAKLSRMGEKIWEVPISYNPRTAMEGKKIRWRDGWISIWTLVRYRFVPRRYFERTPGSEERTLNANPGHATAGKYFLS